MAESLNSTPSRRAPIPLANLDTELLTSADPMDEDSEQLDTLRELLPRDQLHKPGELHSPTHVHFGEKSLSAPSSPMDKERPERQRWSTGPRDASGRGFGRPRGSARRMSRQLSAQFSRGTSYTLDRMRHVSQRTFSHVDPTDENPERGTWSSQAEFFLSCLGYAVGLGNVWRFPYLCHKNGGGAFLIPYAIMLIFCGLPLLMLELSLGQYASQGPITIWKIAPIFKGIGIGMVMISIYLATYYNMITGWAFYYLYKSLAKRLPWRCCEAWFAKDFCIDLAKDCVALPPTQYRNMSESAIEFVQNMGNLTNLSSFTDAETKKALAKMTTFSADDYFHRVALAVSSSINELGTVQLHLFVALLVAWLVVFLVLMRGIKSFGKAVYFTSIFPYIILFILLIRSAIEPGAAKGVIYFLKPRWERLKDARVWGDAVTQIFFSTSICTGGVITLASYNRFHNNCYRDALIIGFGNSLTSIFSGFVVFSILGFMAEQRGSEIDEIVKGGPGLTFIIYPQAVTLLPISPLWSAMFFVMLVTLALSSMFPTVENITTAVTDQFQFLRAYKFWVTLVTCVLIFLMGLLLTTNCGIYVLNVLDKFAVGFALVYIGIFEIFVFAWLYGADRVRKNIASMTTTVSVYWRYIWKFVCPFLLVFCLLFTWIDDTPLEYGGVPYPHWANVLGWILSFSSFIMIPIYAIFLLVNHYRKKRWQGLKQALQELSSPSLDWGPALPEYRGAEDIAAGNDDVFDTVMAGIHEETSKRPSQRRGRNGEVD